MADGISATQTPRITPEEPAVDGPLVGAARAVETTVRRVRDKAADLREQASRKTVGEILGDAREFVRENPGTTILISAGVGALVGYLVARRRS